MNTLLTGANGFLGINIIRAFNEKRPITLGLTGCDINIDLSLNVPEFKKSFQKVIHAAGLAHIRPGSDEDARRLFNVNATGTANLLMGLEKLRPLPRFFIFISTVAVYGLEEGESIDETAPLNGSTPYALSKIEAENLISNWGGEHGVSTLILRLPLIAGANPPGNLGTMINAIRKGYYFRIGDGSARRSMVLADDIAKFVASYNGSSGTYNLTDGYNPSVREVEIAIASAMCKKIKVLPNAIVQTAACMGDFFPFFPINSLKYKKLTSSLTFSDAKARREIGWQSKPVIENLVV